MADRYVYSGAAGAANGTSWTDAYTTISAALTAAAAGDTIWVADDHAHSVATSITYTIPASTATNPVRVICALRTGGSVPPVAADLRTTAVEEITSTGNFAFSGAGGRASYWYGVQFYKNAGTGSFNAQIQNQTNIFESCKFRGLSTTSNSSKIAFGHAQQSVTVLNSCDIEFGNTLDNFYVRGRFVMRGGTIAASGSIPANLFGPNGAGGVGVARFEGVDLSNVSGNIVNATGDLFDLRMLNCKLHASAVVSNAVSTAPSSTVQAINCDSGDTNYRSEKHAFNAALTTETTIVRTGGASDGTTPIAWKIVSSTLQNKYTPFESFPIQIWNDTIGSAVTVTVECRAAAIPNDDEVWMEVEYLGTSGSTKATIATTRPAINATGAAITSSSETWGGSTASFKLSTSVTPQEAGPITVRVYAGKASHTFYVDPKLTVA